MSILAPPPPILELLRSQPRFVITTHQRPDADAIGSALALHLALTQMGKASQPVHLEAVPELCRFLPETSSFQPAMSHAGNAPPVVIVLDCDGPPRAAISETDFQRCTPKVVIDHHATTARTSSLDWVVPDASATGELVFELITCLGIEITPDIATNLYAAITTDTGWFRFSNTTPHAMTVCAQLVASRADIRAVSKHLFEERSFSSAKLLGRALGSLETDCDGLLAWATLTRQDFQECKATDDETEGIVNHVKGVRGSEVAIVFREDSQGKVRVSLRSESRVDVSRIAQQYGGGGHAPAAGCTFSLSLPESQQQILAVVRSELANLKREA